MRIWQDPNKLVKSSIGSAKDNGRLQYFYFLAVMFWGPGDRGCLVSSELQMLDVFSHLQKLFQHMRPDEGFLVFEYCFRGSIV